MPRIRPATLDDADGICHFMHAHMNSEIAADTWRRLFTYRWHPSPPDLGFIVVDDGEIGGYMGTIYHQRRIEGELQTFCNLSSWFIAKPFRGQGLGRESLAQALEQRHRYHHSVLSAARNTARIFTTLQYPLLETHRYVLKPEVGGEWLEVLENPDEFRAQLGDVDTRILDDHLAYGCRHPNGSFILITDEGGCRQPPHDGPALIGTYSEDGDPIETSIVSTPSQVQEFARIHAIVHGQASRSYPATPWCRAD